MSLDNISSSRTNNIIQTSDPIVVAALAGDIVFPLTLELVFPAYAACFKPFFGDGVGLERRLEVRQRLW